jgi:DNA-3-methyladenine glycosylase
MTGKILPKSFYTRTDVVQISKELLGKLLVTNFEGQHTSGIIVETEAYRGPDDKACHAHMNRFTKRTQTMFEEGGVAYIYLCYGIHHLFNVVTAQKNMPHAVLVRAVEPVEGIPLMQSRRNMDKLQRRLTAGPGILSKALGINKTYTGSSLLVQKSGIWIEDIDQTISEEQIIASPRVGVDYAEDHALWPWRFRIKDSKWTSPAK